MVLFRCNWYNQEGKTVGIKDDGHFKSININSFWYKSDPFILATQSIKIFYLQDNDLGNDWRVVQKFEHRGIYDVPEKNGDVHQDDYCFDTEHAVHEGDEYAADDVHQHEDAYVIEANLADLVMGDSSDDEEGEEEYEDDGDDTILDYCTDTDANGNGDDDDDEDDDL